MTCGAERSEAAVGLIVMFDDVRSHPRRVL